MKKLAAVLALVLSSFIVAPALGAPARAADDPYTAGVRCSCNVSVPTVVEVGSAPRIRVDVQPNAPDAGAGRPTGSVRVTISKAGTVIFSETRAYNGSAITIQGPVLNEPGRFRVEERFKPADGSVFRSCQDGASFQLGASDGPDDIDPNAGVDNPGGLLPDTGGPNVVWLLLGLTLVGGGGGLLVASKRKPRGPLYDV